VLDITGAAGAQPVIAQLFGAQVGPPEADRMKYVAQRTFIGGTRRRQRVALVLGLAAWLAAIGLVAHAVHAVQRDSRRQLEERFAIRADSAARFIEVYAREVIAREPGHAFDVKQSPLAAYLPGVSSIRPNAVDLVDSDGTVVASSRGPDSGGLPAPQRANGAARDRRVSFDGEDFRVADRPVSGTPWRLVVTVPEERLYAPLSSSGYWLPWGGLTVFVLASLLVAALLARLLKTRTELEADITQRRHVERELRDAETRFQRAFAGAPIGMALVDLDGAWRQVNRALCTMLRYTEPELLALTHHERTHPDDPPIDMARVGQLIAGEIDHYDIEKRYLDARGDTVWALLSRSLVRDDDGRPLYFIAHIQDISERRRFEAQLSHLADHDALTGLFNRRRLEHELDRQVAYTTRYGTNAALLMLDLDNFKYVNDTLGHAMGDELIVRVAAALRERLRETDVLARLGGDEFAIILPETDAAAAALVATGLLETIGRDGVVLHDRRAIQVSASIGIAAIEPGVVRTPAELMMNADVAMYDAKESGRSRFAVHDPDDDSADRLTDTMTWAEAIRRALADDAFVLYQQPILDLRTDTIARHELLLRMVGADGEHVAPAMFIYIAERFGLIQEIDAWVVRQAVALVADQQRQHGRRLQLEVNLSGLSLTSPEVIATIERELEQTAIDPSCLTFEITETAAIVNIQQARTFAERLAELGCGFALDDFGAGFGSFYYLKHLPFDVLKIDGEFIRNVTNSVEDQVVVRSLASIATELGKKTVAEFVEDDATLALVRSYGVDYAQGYGIGRPQLVSEWLAPEISITSPPNVTA
jgi:diguanylate cyclase (GGDEF)-like protein/PAS domain S-box-containing protein